MAGYGALVTHAAPALNAASGDMWSDPAAPTASRTVSISPPESPVAIETASGSVLVRASASRSVSAPTSARTSEEAAGAAQYSGYASLDSPSVPHRTRSADNNALSESCCPHHSGTTSNRPLSPRIADTLARTLCYNRSHTSSISVTMLCRR